MDKKEFDRLSIEQQTHFIVVSDKIIETNKNWIIPIAKYSIYTSMFILLLWSSLHGEFEKEVLDDLAKRMFQFYILALILTIVGLTYEFTYRRRLINQKLNNLLRKYNKNGKRK